MIMMTGKRVLLQRGLLGIYDNNIYGFWGGIFIVQTMTFSLVLHDAQKVCSKH